MKPAARLLLALLLAWIAAPLARPESTPRPAAGAAGVEAYAALPGARQARLSPDGKLLALVAPVEGRNALVVWDLDGKDKSRVIPVGQFEPEWFVWKSSRRLVAALRIFSLRDPFHPTADTRLIAIDIDGSNPRDLVDARLFGTYIPQIQDKVVSLLPEDPAHILLELPAIDRSTLRPGQTSTLSQFGSLESRLRYPEVVKVDIQSGQLQTVARPRGWVVDWRADAGGRVRIGHAIHGGEESWEVRGAAEESWRTLQSFANGQGHLFDPLAFVDDQPDRLYVLSNHGGANGLYEFDVPTSSFVRTVFADPAIDVGVIVRDGRVVGYRTGPGRPAIYLDAGYARDARTIDHALPGAFNEIVDRSQDGHRVLVRAHKGNEPESWWLLDRSGAKPVLTAVVESYPDLDASRIAETRELYFPARDGTSIPALLTLPTGRRPDDGGTPIAFVVLPHGGPSAHDTPGFDYLVQFLTSLGYGVLQPQFRGSTGHGAAFETAGYRQWGGLMQDDVTDGTRWLVQRKLADPARIAIVGASYGGYSALMGPVREPGLFRCVVAIAPVTDLRELVDDLATFLFSDVNVPRIGEDAKILEESSPIHHIERLGLPVLLIHGRKDYTVPVRHTEQLADALARAGKPAQVLYLDQADHFLSRGDDRLAVLRALQEFLRAQLAAN